MLCGRRLPMAFCEEADLRGHPKNSVLGEHPGRKVAARPPSRDECHAVGAMKPRAWNKRRESHRAGVRLGTTGTGERWWSFFCLSCGLPKVLNTGQANSTCCVETVQSEMC
jgi:hypothetical protein